MSIAMYNVPNLRRWLAAGVFTALIFMGGCDRTPIKGPAPAPAPGPGGAGPSGPRVQPEVPVEANQKDLAPAANPNEWTMFGGSQARNMVNTTAKNLPVEWSVEEGEV